MTVLCMLSTDVTQKSNMKEIEGDHQQMCYRKVACPLKEEIKDDIILLIWPVFRSSKIQYNGFPIGWF